MSPTISPINITAAALTAQIFLVIIMFIGAAVWHAGDDLGIHSREQRTQLAWIILLFAILTLVPLIFSSDFSAAWRPLFGTAPIPVLSSGTAMFLMFAFDILCVAWLIGSTGGSRSSPFTAIYFALPALAIFLREPFSRVSFYTMAIITLFFFQLAVGRDHARGITEQTEKLAYGIVSILCVILTTVIGFVTRPQ